jgi:NAD(P)-dependent dehydrogenase (short-subunit alcohol dehydrogenase family)
MRLHTFLIQHSQQGGSGIGHATALRFADSGAKIVVADMGPGDTDKEINSKHGKDRAIFIKCDVTQENQIASMVDEAAKWGGRVDIICNYAGLFYNLGELGDEI